MPPDPDPDAVDRADRLLERLLTVLRIIPPGVAWAAGQFLGDLFGALPMRDQRRAAAHLTQAFPGRDAAWVARTVRRGFRHFGGMALWNLATLHRPASTFRRGLAVEGVDNLRELARACRRGEGTLGFSGHFGNWELLPRLGGDFVPTSVIGKRLRNARLDRLIRRARARGGATVIYQDDDVRTCVRELRAGKLLGTLPDQDIARLAGVFVPWFGRDAYTPSGPAGLALLANVPVQPIFCYRRAGRWVLHLGPRRKFPRTKDRAADIAAITAWAMAYEEALIRRAPHHWVWWHPRWRTRPEDVARAAAAAAAKAAAAKAAGATAAAAKAAGAEAAKPASDGASP
jgi:KDO2-lipid IV(A) lauroyltransferase